LSDNTVADNQPDQARKLAASGRSVFPFSGDVYWGYDDVGILFMVLSCLNVALRLAIRLRLLAQHELDQPSLGLHILVTSCLTCSLFAILKIRYHRPVWRSLGWILPSRRYLGIAALIGVLLALGGNVPGHGTNREVTNWAWGLFAATVVPFFEESFFRGCLLPLVARSSGAVIATLVTALLFSVFHQPRTTAQWAWVVATGVAYGWIRLASGSTTASALMHIAYNSTLLLCWRL
jgi:membrane protease YdiL (CAAX protease family)